MLNLRSTVALLVVAAGCASPQRAQSGSADPGSGRLPPPATSFDGEVIGVDRVAPGDSLASNVRLVIRPESGEPVTIELAPGWYLEEQGLALSTSQRVRIRGKRSSGADGGQTVVAWNIESGERSVPLRDESGRPMWRRALDAAP